MLPADILRCAIPVEDKLLKEELSSALSELLIIRYPDVPYLKNYLKSTTHYPTVILLPTNFNGSA
jgi:hypothetical protein